MKRTHQLATVIEREGERHFALCPELDVASQGDSVEEARKNLTEAVELFFEAADPKEVGGRLRRDIFVTRLAVAGG
jgi:predicted RNase H-like HicB family nuclease